MRARGFGAIAPLVLIVSTSAHAQAQAQSGAPTPPVAITSHAITEADYPPESIRLREQGTIGVRYRITETGDVTDCTVQMTSNLPRLDVAACGLVGRWKYRPATQDGKATDTMMTANIVFQLRGDRDDYERGVEAARRGDFETAIGLWRPLAEAGVAPAQAALGGAYQDGKGVPQNPETGADWFRRAAEQGFPPAQNALGALYGNGRGVPRDPVQAARWFERAAEQGFLPAQRNLGVLYSIGQGVPRNPGEAVRWLRPAAEQNDAEAQFRLALLYQSGEGIAQDEAQAATLFRRAAEQGHAFAQTELGRAYFSNRGVPVNPIRALMWFSIASAPAVGGAPPRPDNPVAVRYRDDLRRTMPQSLQLQADALIARCTGSQLKDCDAPIEPVVVSQAGSPITPPQVTTSMAVTAQDYPEISIRLQEQGMVGIRYTVAADGSVRECTVTGSSGKTRLDEAACAMVRRRTFQPAMQDGMPVEFTTDFFTVFELR